MTNYGTKFNETARTPEELRRLTLEWQGESDTQRQARLALRFIEEGHPDAKNGEVATSEAELMATDYDEFRKLFLAVDRMPWEARTPGHLHNEPVPNKPWWLRSLLDPTPPWWKRLWRWVDPRKQFRDWNRDEEARAARSRNHGKLHISDYD